ncbi:MAG: carboxypeptidase-like regulatory domain-containing protein [Bryobacteraceae bacterium]|nr:carboxypeptidase-like regulatory domain-containing protein [Bryobacteraceae bacterium]MDW8378418.1 carboxypeptidase-like regulatory domain-containing protein [Bryobacterales bacterium]
MRCLVLFLALSAFAQDYRGRVQGTVTDSTDAAVVGAKITICNLGTGVSATRQSGPNGVYLFDNVEPGSYVVTAELQGFSKQVREGVLVSAVPQRRAPDLLPLHRHRRANHRRLRQGQLLVAMQAAPPVIPADLLALSQPKFHGVWVFSDSNNRRV